MKNKKIVIAGGTGFIGQGLVEYFGTTNELVVLGRQVADKHKNLYSDKLLTGNDGYNVRYVRWNGRDLEESWTKEIDGADIIVNLAGKSVNCRYHKKQKKEIIESRTHAVKAIAEAISKAVKPPALWINAASATIYKNSLEKPNDEFTGVISDLKKDNMPYNIIDHLRFLMKKDRDYDFSVAVCKAWEKSFFESNTPHTRKVALRTAITLGKDGVIVPYINLCKFGLGGKQGSGKQMFTWVHIEDIARMIEWISENKQAEGIYNCASPNAVTNKDFMKTLRTVTGYKFGLPAPAVLLELGAFLIGTETELILKSRWVLPERAIREGFEFKYKDLKDAFLNIIHSPYVIEKRN